MGGSSEMRTFSLWKNIACSLTNEGPQAIKSHPALEVGVLRLVKIK